MSGGDRSLLRRHLSLSRCATLGKPFLCETLGAEAPVRAGDDRLRGSRSYLADQVGITQIRAQASPEEKLDIVRQETAKAKTLYVGDGINDAPAMMAATVGMAIGQNSDVTSEAHDRAPECGGRNAPEHRRDASCGLWSPESSQRRYQPGSHRCSGSPKCSTGGISSKGNSRPLSRCSKLRERRTGPRQTAYLQGKEAGG